MAGLGSGGRRKFVTTAISMSECDELKPWLYALIIVPSIFNVFSLVLLIISVVLIRRLRTVADTIKSTTHWLMRTAVRVGLGPKAKRALLAYARSKPELQRLVVQPPSPAKQD
uniref:Uncharacterized protein n=1 Tax=Ditylenchus dipsaci TaxID=166011 RepID=A0A915EL95_9BILA